METIIGLAESSQTARGEKLKNRMPRKLTMERENHEKNKNGRGFFTKLYSANSSQRSSRITDTRIFPGN